MHRCWYKNHVRSLYILGVWQWIQWVYYTDTNAVHQYILLSVLKELQVPCCTASAHYMHCLASGTWRQWCWYRVCWANQRNQWLCIMFPVYSWEEAGNIWQHPATVADQDKLPLLHLAILALPGPNSTTVRGPGKRAFKITSQSLWPGFASANQLSVWNASLQLLIHDHLPFSSSVILKGRVQNSRSWHLRIKSINQITRNQGNTCYTRGHHNQASRIFNMIGWW